MRPSNENIKTTLNLVEEMIKLANKGDIEREDTGCGILYGVLRDSAYKIKKLAEKEKENHIYKGWWTIEQAQKGDKKVSNDKQNFKKNQKGGKTWGV